MGLETSNNVTSNKSPVTADQIEKEMIRISVEEEARKVDRERADNWSYRSAKMKCKTCMSYVPKLKRSGQVTRIGRCRYDAPTMSGFPIVYESDWCMKHRIDENKLDDE